MVFSIIRQIPYFSKSLKSLFGKPQVVYLAHVIQEDGVIAY